MIRIGMFFTMIAVSWHLAGAQPPPVPQTDDPGLKQVSIVLDGIDAYCLQKGICEGSFCETYLNIDQIITESPTETLGKLNNFRVVLQESQIDSAHQASTLASSLGLPILDVKVGDLQTEDPIDLERFKTLLYDTDQTYKEFLERFRDYYKSYVDTQLEDKKSVFKDLEFLSDGIKGLEEIIAREPDWGQNLQQDLKDVKNQHAALDQKISTTAETLTPFIEQALLDDYTRDYRNGVEMFKIFMKRFKGEA